MKNSQAKFSLQLLALLKNRCNQSRVFLVTLISVAVFGCGTGSGPSSITEPATGKTLSLIWADEFNGVSLDTSKWNYDTGYGDNGWGNDEWQMYTSSSNNVAVENGNLVITARCDAGNCGKQDGTTTSGRITTKGKFYTKYGSIQARIKVPGGRGTWPAFWMLGTNIDIVDWPKCGEIDIMEVTKYDAADKTTHTTIHWSDKAFLSATNLTGWTYFSGSKTFAESLSNDYHVYEVDWNADRIIGKIDGITYYTKVIDPATMEEFLKKFYLLFNVAVGGNLAADPNSSGTSWPQSMYVDWVRVYGSAPFVPSASATDLGVYSETKDLMVPYSKIINSADWGVSSVVPNQASTAVTTSDGTYVLSATYSNSSSYAWNGMFIEFDPAYKIIGSYKTLNFSLNTSQFTGFSDMTIKFEDKAKVGAEVLLSKFIPEATKPPGNWVMYKIPLTAFTAIKPALDLTTLTYLGFMMPKNGSGALIDGTLYLDDIYFSLAN